MSDFFDAVKKGDASRVAALLDAEPALAGAAENDVLPVLMAMYHGHADVAHMIAERRETVTFPEACVLGDGDRVRRMLDAEPGVLDRRSADGYPPLGLAIFFRHQELARFLIERGADVNTAASNKQRVAPLHAAAAVGDRETIALLLARGADPNARQESDFTPLHSAASHGDIEMARMLLASGADPEAKSEDGKTPADVAKERGFPEFAGRLGT